VEQAVLAAVSFPSALQSTVSLHDTLHLGYKVTFDTGSEVISTEGTNLAKLNEWLVSKACAFKKGELHKQERKTYSAVKDAVRLESAIDELRSKNSGCNIVDALSGTAPCEPIPANKSDSVEDVTDTILSVPKVHSVDLPQAHICIHRGSLKTFIKHCASTANMCGVLAGRVGWNEKLHITNIVQTTKSPNEFVADEKLVQTCASMKLTIYGFIMCGPEDELRTCASDVLSMCSCEFPLFLGVDHTTKPTGAYFSMERQSDGFLKAVAPTWTSNPHDISKKMTYNICWDSDLGVSVMAAATNKICDAVVAHAMSKFNDTNQTNESPDTTTRFNCINVPPDGYCGWHSLIAAEDLMKFDTIPRAKSGYAINARMVKQEEDAAKSLCTHTCDTALTQCCESLHADIIRVKNEDQFGPLDLQWIAQVLKLSIRCTCSKQDGFFRLYKQAYTYIARFVLFGILSLYIYIYNFKLIYIVR